jgi:hypothetical protein
MEEQVLAAANEMEPELLGSPGIRDHGARIIDRNADPHEYILNVARLTQATVDLESLDSLG